MNEPTTVENGNAGQTLAPVSLLDDDESQCRKPCDPDTNCPECEGFWERMSREGYWDMKKHRWTDKGWHEITRVI